MKDNLIAGLRYVTRALDLSNDKLSFVEIEKVNIERELKFEKQVIDNLNARINELEVGLHKKELDLENNISYLKDIDEVCNEALNMNDTKIYLKVKIMAQTIKDLDKTVKSLTGYKSKASKLNAEKRKFMEIVRTEFRIRSLGNVYDDLEKAIFNKWNKWLKERKKGDQS